MTCGVTEHLGWSETISLASVIKWSAMTGVTWSRLWISNSNGHLQVDQKAVTICENSGKKLWISSHNPWRDSEPTSCHVGAICSHEVQCGIKDMSTHPEELKVCRKCLEVPFRIKGKKHLPHVQGRSPVPVFLGHFACHPAAFNGYCLAFKESRYFCLLLRKKRSKIGRSFKFVLIYDNTVWLWTQTNQFLIVFPLFPKHSLCFRSIWN